MENLATARVARTSALVQICWDVSVAACRIDDEVWEEMVERRSWKEGPGGSKGVGDGDDGGVDGVEERVGGGGGVGELGGEGT